MIAKKEDNEKKDDVLIHHHVQLPTTFLNEEFKLYIRDFWNKIFINSDYN